MSLIVQKYGGSSVADAAGIQRVARRVVATQRAGHKVVVVVSAMGDTTDDLLDLAESITDEAPKREMDILLSSGERISMALLAMAVNANGSQARSFTGSQRSEERRVGKEGRAGGAKALDIRRGRSGAE